MGEWWKDRLDCRQWGAHFPHVAGIAGQSGVGSQSVVLSGGYEDDKDEGEWFLYTGSGGRDLSGNKRTNKVGRGGTSILTVTLPAAGGEGEGGRVAGTLMAMLPAAMLSRGPGHGSLPSPYVIYLYGHATSLPKPLFTCPCLPKGMWGILSEHTMCRFSGVNIFIVKHSIQSGRRSISTDICSRLSF